MMSKALKLQLEFYHPVKNKEKDLMKTMSIAVCSLGVGLGLAIGNDGYLCYRGTTFVVR